MIRLKKMSALMLLAALGFAGGCKKDATPTNTGNYPVEIRMTDAPGPYEAVTIDLQDILVNSEGGDKGWVSLNPRKGKYDLLKLTNGLDTLIGSGNLPSGHISQIRLVLGEDNTVQVDGAVHDLETPSAQQSGLKLQVHEVLTEGITYQILLDFDAARSIVEKGNGKYSLKPVIRTITNATSGAIKGQVDPVASHPTIYAVQGTDTTGGFADANGYFLIRGLIPGSYNVYFDAAAPFKSRTDQNVPVSLGTVTEMGVVTISQ